MSETNKSNNFGPMQDFTNGYVRVDGFWQDVKVGETVKGILIGERRTEAGSALKQGYYIFELTEEFPRMVTRADPSKPGSKENRKEIIGKVGQHIGVKDSFDMKGIGRKLGHYFEITFKEEVPTKKPGQTIKKFDKKVSKNVIKEIEKVEEAVADAANDTKDEIPF
jgi:hypothetical protein